MFGEKAQKIRDLTQELENVREDPYYKLAEQIDADVDASIAAGAAADTALGRAVEQRKAELLQARIDKEADERAKVLIRQEKQSITAAVTVEADRLAQLALARFLEHDAEPYRTAQEEVLTAKRETAIITAAKKELTDEAYRRRVEAAKQRLADEPDKETLRLQYKTRAGELRATTKRTRMLPMSDLRVSDPLTIAFTHKDGGFAQLTGQSGWSTAYRSDLELRKISGTVVDTASGLFEVDRDSSWLDDPDDEGALRGGQQVYLLGENPLTDTEDYEPVIVKGDPLVIKTLGGLTLPQTMDVWWVNLGDFRALA